MSKEDKLFEIAAWQQGCFTSAQAKEGELRFSLYTLLSYPCMTGGFNRNGVTINKVKFRMFRHMIPLDLYELCVSLDSSSEFLEVHLYSPLLKLYRVDLEEKEWTTNKDIE
jgi:hypothetical protein